jgi:hypothetical protein
MRYNQQQIFFIEHFSKRYENIPRYNA